MGFLRKGNQDVYNSKTVEILAAGGFMLSEYSKHIQNIFKNKKDLVFFNDDKLEILKTVKYYLKNSKLREKIKNNGYKKVNKGLFNYSSQLVEIINFKI